MEATVELRELVLPVDLGTYGPDDVVPDAHYLDFTLTIDPKLALVERDSMDAIFDYDPLIAKIDAIARDQHYETQEWLITRIARACVQYAEIKAVDLHVYKGPVLAGSGKLGVRLSLDRAEMDRL
ncbi:MAG: dihydroneopterin aldolase [Pseudomonadota bacterium]